MANFGNKKMTILQFGDLLCDVIGQTWAIEGDKHQYCFHPPFLEEYERADGIKSVLTMHGSQNYFGPGKKCICIFRYKIIEDEIGIWLKFIDFDLNFIEAPNDGECLIFETPEKERVVFHRRGIIPDYSGLTAKE